MTPNMKLLVHVNYTAHVYLDGQYLLRDCRLPVVHWHKTLVPLSVYQGMGLDQNYLVSLSSIPFLVVRWFCVGYNLNLSLLWGEPSLCDLSGPYHAWNCIMK